MLDSASERVILARHATFDGEIQLQQRLPADGKPVYEIIYNGVFLMASYNQTSERMLARVALESLSTSLDLRVLIGGLGMGFTLQQALEPNVTAIDVVEINHHLVEWNRTCFAPLNINALSDLRVRLIQDDVYTVLCTSSAGLYHAILLDVDNGPSWLAHPNNARLYNPEALAQWSKLLKPGGCLAVWSAQQEPEFLANLRVVFSRVDEISVMAPLPQKAPVENFIYCALLP